jgi:uncharacterized protein
VNALTTTLARSLAGGRVGVLFTGDASSSLMLSLVVHIVGQARVVALLGPVEAATGQRCEAARVADLIGAPTFDMSGLGIEDALRALELSAVVLSDHTDRGDTIAATVSPLIDAGLDATAATRLARELSVPFLDETLGCRTHDEAQEADMHVDVDRTTEVVVQVEAAESELRRLGLGDLRVRYHGDLARLEAPHTQLSTMTSEPLRGEILRAVRSAGFRRVAVDLGAVTEIADA